MRKKWLVGITMDGKTSIKEYSDGINTHGLWVHRQFQAVNAERSAEIRAWLDVCLEQWRMKVVQIKNAERLFQRLYH